MKKIGIITYPRIEDGKGRFLQAYCLYVSVKVLGYDAEILNYQPDSFYKQRNIFQYLYQLMKRPSLLLSYLRKLEKTIFSGDKAIQRDRSGYLNFIDKNINYDIDNIKTASMMVQTNDQYDAFICGSDQIWNPDYFGLNPVYFLMFADKKKRIAYAASTGKENISSLDLSRISKYVNEIPYCSVREKTMKERLTPFCNHVEAVCDPTFLCDREWWSDFAQLKLADNYILLFLFDNSKEPQKLARILANKTKLRIVTIAENELASIEGMENVIDSEPRTFAGLFKGAKYIITQSFHGVVLSLIYNKDFFVFDRSDDSDSIILRIQDLLDTYHLSERIVSTADEIDNRRIDYSGVNKIMDEQREKGREFLRFALENASKNGF